MKKNFILISIGAVLTITLIALILLQQPSVTLHLSQPLGSNMRFAKQVSADEIYYFNGSAFISRSITKGTSTALSDILTLPNVTDVRWGSHGTLFKATAYSSVDQLYPRLTNLHLSTDKAYWWLYDFKTKSLTVVGSALSSNNTFAPGEDVIWNSDGASITFVQPTYLSSGSSEILVRQGSGSSPVQIGLLSRHNNLLYANADVVYLVENTEKTALIKYTLANRKLTKLTQSHAIVGSVNPAGDTAVIIAASNTSDEGSASIIGDMKILPGEKGNDLDKVASNITGSILWDSMNSWLELGPVKDTLSGYTQQLGSKISRVQIDTGKQKINQVNLSLASYFNGQALLLSDNNTTYLAGTSVPDVTVKSKDPSSLQQPIYTNDFYSTYDVDKQQYTIYILHNPYQDGIKKSIRYIQNLGIDPFSLNIKWYPYDGVNIN